MLMFLFVLSAISFILLFVMPVLQKKKLNKIYTILLLVQSGSIGAIFGILAVALIKGSSLG